MKEGRKERAMETTYFAGGCFWGLEKYFGSVRGVISTEVGYANSLVDCPSYQQVCTGATNAAETVRIVYDPGVVSFRDLLRLLFAVIDPTAVNRQGNDVGTQYRTGVYTTNADQLQQASSFIAELQSEYMQPIAVEVTPIENFYPAEEYHQKYLDKNPLGYCHIGKEAFNYARNYKVSETG